MLKKQSSKPPSFHTIHQSVSVIANLLARLCHPIGKPLPSHWQNFANAMAKDRMNAYVIVSYYYLRLTY